MAPRTPSSCPGSSPASASEITHTSARSAGPAPAGAVTSARSRARSASNSASSPAASTRWTPASASKSSTSTPTTAGIASNRSPSGTPSPTTAGHASGSVPPRGLGDPRPVTVAVMTPTVRPNPHPRTHSPGVTVHPSAAHGPAGHAAERGPCVDGDGSGGPRAPASRPRQGRGLAARPLGPDPDSVAHPCPTSTRPYWPVFCWMGRPSGSPEKPMPGDSGSLPPAGPVIGHPGRAGSRSATQSRCNMCQSAGCSRIMGSKAAATIAVVSRICWARSPCVGRVNSG